MKHLGRYAGGGRCMGIMRLHSAVDILLGPGAGDPHDHPLGPGIDKVNKIGQPAKPGDRAIPLAKASETWCRFQGREDLFPVI